MVQIKSLDDVKTIAKYFEMSNLWINYSMKDGEGKYSIVFNDERHSITIFGGIDKKIEYTDSCLFNKNRHEVSKLLQYLNFPIGSTTELFSLFLREILINFTECP